ncbi:MAG: PilZ domain-containing protein [Treponema sp.]|nr:PilZ domain-containing protein [Treponema sp.]
MGEKKRQTERFDDIGRVEAHSLCPLAGVLDNISAGGCKVHYNLPVVVDLENDYEVNITFARAASEGSLVLTCHPQWVHEENGTTEIGFKILPSKDLPRLLKYIEELGLDQVDSSIAHLITNSGCQLI